MRSERPCDRFTRSGSGRWPVPRPRTLRDILPLVTVPTLLVYGDSDVRAPLSVAEKLHAAIARSTLFVLPDAGHVCNIEAPEVFNTAVRTFLRDKHC